MSARGLSTLANVCDLAQKLTNSVSVSDLKKDSQATPLGPSFSISENKHGCLESDIFHNIFPRSSSAPSVSDNGCNLTSQDPYYWLSPSNNLFTVCEHSKEVSRTHTSAPTSPVLAPGSHCINCYNHAIPYCNEVLTPPPTPELQSVLPSMSPINSRHLNPLQRNAIAYAIFEQYLDETWPKDSQRIGGGVIRASLYAKITNTLLGGVAPARLRLWVKRSEFFLTPTSNLSPTDCGFQLAIPVHRPKKRGTAPSTRTAGKTKHTANTYRLVAQLEEFVNIIGCYHNDEVGHHGIRKTHAMIHEHYSHVPRTAVSKYIELCEVCSLHKHKNKTKSFSSTSTTDCMHHSNSK